MVMGILGKNPKAIPNIIPNSKEASRNELTNVWRNATSFEGAHNNVVEQEINSSYEQVALGNLGLMFRQVLIVKDPVPLQQVVNDPPTNIGAQFCPP